MTDYATLQSRLADRSARTNLTAVIPSFIETAEDMIRNGYSDPLRGIDIPAVRVTAMQQHADLVVPDAGYVALPERFLGFRSVALSVANSASQGAECNYLPPDPFHEKRLNSGAFSGLASSPFYTIEGGNLWLLPTPGAGTTATVSTSYWQSFPVLDSVTNTTNWLLTNNFSLYLWAALADLYDYLQEPVDEAKYLAKFAGAVRGLHRSERRKARSGPHIRRPGGVTP